MAQKLTPVSQNNNNTRNLYFAILNDLIEEKLASKKKLWLSVLSGSMAPLIPIGSKVLIKDISSPDIHFGDIVAFKSGSKLIIHRILGKYYKGKETFFLQGGDFYSKAFKIHKDNIIGKVIEIQRNGRTIRLDNLIGKMLNKYLALIGKTKYHIEGLFLYIRSHALKGKVNISFSLTLKAVKTPLIFVSNIILKLLIKVAQKES